MTSGQGLPIPDGMALCGHCNGYGSSLKEASDRCTRCDGRGLVRAVVATSMPEPAATIRRLLAECAPGSHDHRLLSLLAEYVGDGQVDVGFDSFCLDVGTVDLISDDHIVGTAYLSRDGLSVEFDDGETVDPLGEVESGEP